MKIIGLDKYEREWVGDEVVIERIANKDYAERVVRFYNFVMDPSRIYIVVPDGYHLNPGMVP